MLQAGHDREPPVVVALHDSAGAGDLFRSAVDEALGRGLPLVVLDFADIPLHDLIWGDGPEIGEEERHTLKGLWANPHVRVERVEDVASGLEKTLAFCEANRTTLLVVAADTMAEASADPTLVTRLMSGDFDLLIVTDR